MLNIQKIFSLFYNDNLPLLSTVLAHSECVAQKAIACIVNRKLKIDTEFILEAAMLHDIGVIRCNAPSIFCYGEKPYICHGVEGREMLSGIGLSRHALICERHTGSGLTMENIIGQTLPLPHRNMLPISIEEKLICYADKFFSKSGNLTEEKPIDKVINQMQSFGTDSLQRFLDLHELFG